METKLKQQKADAVLLIGMGDFKQAIKKVLSNTKIESDRQMAEFQASNLRKREAKKRR